MGQDPSNAERVREVLRRMFRVATDANKRSIIVISKNLHDVTSFADGSHPNQMPTVCNVMHEFKHAADKILHETPSGRSTTLRIEYVLPRPHWR